MTRYYIRTYSVKGYLLSVDKTPGEISNEKFLQSFRCTYQENHSDFNIFPLHLLTMKRN